MQKTYSFGIYNNDEFENLLKYMANAFCPSFLKWPIITEAARLLASYFDDIVKSETGEICIVRQDCEKQITSKYLSNCIKKYLFSDENQDNYIDEEYSYKIPIKSLKFYCDFLSGKSSKLLSKKYENEFINEKIGIPNNPAQCSVINSIKQQYESEFNKFKTQLDIIFEKRKKSSDENEKSELMQKEKEIEAQYLKYKKETEKQINSIC